MKKNEFVYDNEELALLEEIANGEWVDDTLDKDTLDAYAKSAAYTKSLTEKR